MSEVTGTIVGGEASDAAAAAAATRGQAKALAATIAAATFGQPAPDSTGRAGVVVTPTPPPPPQSTDTAPPAQPAGTVDAAPAGTEAGAAVEEVVEEAAEDRPSLSEVEKALSEVGIELGVNSAELPLELVPAYEQLVYSTVDAIQDLIGQQVEAAQAIKAVQDFRERLDKAPEKVLLTLAVSQPEVFKEVIRIFGEMEAEPRIKEAVVRELQSEARLQEADRKEAALLQRDARLKGRAVAAATRRAATKHGVPVAVAERVVAAIVTGNGGNLEVSDVDAIVADLRSQPKTTQKRIVTPARAAATAAAPGSPAAPGATPPGTATPSAGLQINPGSKIRQVIRNAFSRIPSQ